jgi:hypothetical protein
LKLKGKYIKDTHTHTAHTEHKGLEIICPLYRASGYISPVTCVFGLAMYRTASHTFDRHRNIKI